MNKPYFETELGKLYHGDCLEVTQDMGDIDCVITSPPFWNLIKYSDDPKDLSNITLETFKSKIDELIKMIAKLIKSGGKICWEFMDYPYSYERNNKKGLLLLSRIFDDLFEKNNLFLFTKTLWRKYTAQGAMQKDGNLFYAHTRKRGTDIFLANNTSNIYVYKKNINEKLHSENIEMTIPEWAYIADGVWDVPAKGFNKLHGSHFSEEIVRRLVLIYSQKNDIVLDPFIGIGTTAIACERLNRRWIGIEISKEYCDIAVERIKQETAQYKMELT